MRNLFFIESPLQLLNAYEVIFEFNLKNYKIIIRLSKMKENDKQIKYLVKYLDIKNVKFITIKAEKKSLNDYIKLFVYQYKFIMKKIDKVFIGNFDSGFFKLILKQFPKEKIILLDDGSKTLAIQKQFSESNFYNLFTMYDITSVKNQIIYKNKYKKLNEKLKSLNIVHNEVLFLGMKLSEIGVISEKEYIRLLQKISTEYKDKNIIYIPHRGESVIKLQKISEIENITIKSYDYPVELLGLFEDSLPYKVASFYSTAVLTMKYIYNIEAECFLFDYNDSQYRTLIDEVYDYYKKVIDVKEIL
jgi:hypothetical protein